MTKKTVTYDHSRGAMKHPSGGMILWPVDHPDSDHVSNASYVLTSPVINVDEEKETFETLNTIYVPDNM